MKSQKTVISFLFSLCVFLFGSVLYADASSESLLQQLSNSPEDALEVSYHGKTGKVRFLKAKRGHAIKQPSEIPSGTAPAIAARNFLAKYGALFGIEDQSRELIVKREKKAGMNRSFVKFQQVRGNIPVLGGELIVQMNSQREIISVNGEISPSPAVNTSPNITAATAKDRALELVTKHHKTESSKLKVSEPELWIYNPALIGPGLDTNILVWRMQVHAADLLPINELVLVDAQNGFVVFHVNEVVQAKQRMIYDNQNDPAYGLPGYGPVRVEGDGPTGIADVDAAYDYSGDTYDFYFNHHGRDSIDNMGMSLISTVRCGLFGSNPNAFWLQCLPDAIDCVNQMVFSEGMATDDTVAHEMTHGITYLESNLMTWFQSGAINESFSDIWGEFVDLTNGKGNDSPEVRWLIGEDGLYGFSRNMKDPPQAGYGQFPQPDRMTSPYYECGAIDGYGIHINSGVNNKAAYLMVDGDVFNGQAVSGIGIAKTVKIYYEVQTNLLTSGSDYADLYDALQLACADLIGVDGITATDCLEVKSAIDAVEMNKLPPSCPPAEAPVCPGTATNVFFDDFESGGTNWEFVTILHEGQEECELWGWPSWCDPWSLSNYFVTSGIFSLHGSDLEWRSDTYARTTSSIPIPAGSYLHFKHSYSFEWCPLINYDGGVLEYSIDQGTTWHDAGPLFIGNGYNGTINPYPEEGDNPLAGRRGFVQVSYGGYISSLADLSSLSGEQAMFRFRIGTDNAVGELGWYIDDVRIYTCDAELPFTTLTTSPSGRNLIIDDVGYKAPQTFNWTPGEIHTVNIFSPQSELPGVEYVFTSWSDGGSQNRDIAAPSTDTMYVANFDEKYLLSILVNPPGAGTVEPDCLGGCWYSSGSMIMLTAQAAGNYTFDSWGGSLTSTDSSIDVEMNEPKLLIANFIPTAGTLQVDPEELFMPSGNAGGPFTPASMNYVLTNVGANTLQWSAEHSGNWMNLSSYEGVLSRGESVTVTVSTNSNANSLVSGSYEDAIFFTNMTNGNGDTIRNVILTINEACDEMIADGSFEAGSPSPYWIEYSTNFGTPIWVCPDSDLPMCYESGVGPRTGNWWAWFGGVPWDETGSVEQQITIPAIAPGSSATLQFYLWNSHSSGNGFDFLKVLVDGEERFFITEGDAEFINWYKEVNIDLSGYADGNTHSLMFLSTVTEGELSWTDFHVDDISLKACKPSTIGKITGGGWINSPQGAYSADTLYTGKATFSFVTTYKENAITPTGQTDFNFADMHFHSESYDWLKINGARAQCKGVGSINGEGGYHFLLTAIDSKIYKDDDFAADLFRIKIWTEDEYGEEYIIYDNGLGANDSSNIATVVEGGSISIR